MHIAQCHYEVELKLTLQICLSLSTAAAAVTANAPHKSAQMACSLFCKCESTSTCCNPKTVSLEQEAVHDLDTDSDTIRDTSDTDVSDNVDC